MMHSEEELLAVIGRIYEAATDPKRMRGLSSLLAPYFDCGSSIIHTCTQTSLEMRSIIAATDSLDTWAWSAYANHYHDCNTWFQRGIRKGPSVVVICEELVPHRELLRSEWYDYCHKVDWLHCLGLGIQIADDLVAGMGFHRPRSGKAFGEGDRRKAYAILPHLERTLQIAHRLDTLTQERDMALNVIDGLGVGVLVVTAEGRAVFANRVAERVLRSGKGLSVSRGRLCAQGLRQRQDLERLVGEAARTSAGASTDAGGVLSLATPSGRPLTLLIAPFRCEAMGYGGPALPAALVLFTDPDTPAGVSEKALRSAYRLSRGQARLLTAILSGQSLTEYAETAHISINTAKSVMKQVFAKTGSSRQTDLIRTIAGNPVFKLADEP